MTFRNRLAQRIYDFLDVGKAPIMADCIFVLAGRQDRKAFGIRMWRIGYAPQLILSVGRYEWRKFKDLGLEADGGLESLVAGTPPEKRHFLVHLNGQTATCTRVQTGFWGTHSESIILEEYLRHSGVRSLLVVSSPMHMRRIALSFRRAFRKQNIQLAFIATPEKSSIDAPAERKAIWTELQKYIVYKLLFL